MANDRSQHTILVELKIDDQGKAHEEVSYTNGEYPRNRKEALLKSIKKHKEGRGKGDGKGDDNSENLHHDSWITKPGEVVAFRCRNYFKLFIEKDRHVCGAIDDAPDNPFDWNGIQEAELGPAGYEVRGTAVYDKKVFDQMFYKFTAYIEGVSEPLDPDGICGGD